MSVISPSEANRSALERSCEHVNKLAGSSDAARQAASRAARNGDLVHVRKGLHHRGVKTRYSMTNPRVEEVVREFLGEVGTGPAGFLAAREWGVTTQQPLSFHVASLWPSDPIQGVTQHSRRNRERAMLNWKVIAQLDFLRAPEVFVEAGWAVLFTSARTALANGEVRVGELRLAVLRERNLAVRTNFAQLIADLTKE